MQVRKAAGGHGQAWELLGPKQTVAGVEPRAVAFDTDLHAVADELDLVQPAGILRGAATSLTSWKGTKSGMRTAGSTGCFRLATGTPRSDRHSSKMRPESSIIVMLLRPRARFEGPEDNERRLRSQTGAPWMLDDGGATIEAIIPTPELEAMLPRGQGIFYARRTEDGWDIIRPVNPTERPQQERCAAINIIAVGKPRA